MRATRLMMGMPITVDVVDAAPNSGVLDDVFAYFDQVDRRFSTYRPDSEIAAINNGRLAVCDSSDEMREVMALAEQTARESGGYFDARRPEGSIDPSGIVKGWAIRNAARRVAQAGYDDFFVDAGGDIQASGRNASGEEWRVGIRNPRNSSEIIKVVRPRGRGVATSGSYVRGHHIYDPHHPAQPLIDVVSLSVIGADVLEADRFATAAFAMGRDGIYFIEQTPGLEGYAVDKDGRATSTSGFGAYCA